MTGTTRARIALVIAAAAALVLAATAAAQVQCAVADRDRLGVRLEGRDGAVRRAGARGGADAGQADQRARRRHGPSARDQDVRHPGQQAGGREGLRDEADRPGRERHLHDLRRRPRRAGRAGVDQRRPAHDRTVHRHRPDGAEAVRRARASSPSASATSPRTRARRWPQFAWNKGWRTAAIATDTVIVYFKDVVGGVPGPLEAARRQDRRLRDVPVARRQQRPERRQPAQRQERRRDRHGDGRCVRRARRRSCRGLRTLGNNTPILNSWAGDGTYWLPKSPQVTNYYFLTYANAFGGDPNKAINKLAKQVKAGDRRLHRRPGGDRRCRDRDPAGARLHERRHARGGDGEVPQRADAVRARELLAEAGTRSSAGSTA